MVNVDGFLSTLMLGIDVNSSIYRLIKYVLTHSTNGCPIKVVALKRLVNAPHEFHTRLPILKNILKQRFGVILKPINMPRSIRVSHFVTRAKIPIEPIHEMCPEDRPGSILLKYVLTYLFLRGERVKDKELFNALNTMGINVDSEDSFFGTGMRHLIEDEFVEMELLNCEHIEEDPLGLKPPTCYFTWGDRARNLFTYDIVIQYDRQGVNKLLNDIQMQPPTIMWN